ncbi:MAG: CPBP family intramembrane glutamic endopeptidase [Xanthobacteraceae bacterium]
MSPVDADIVPPLPPAARPRPVWRFVSTSLWGLFIFVAMFLGQMAVIGYLVWRHGGGLDSGLIRSISGSGITLSLSVITGLPAVLLAIWIATRIAGERFSDYLGLRWPTWRTFFIGLAALIVLVGAWDLLAKAIGREVTATFMIEVLKSAEADNSLWLLLIAFCVAAPVSEEFFARGFLYRGWADSVVRPAGAIVLSSLVWTAMHLQYDWFFFFEIMSIGLLFGYLRHRTGSTWLTVVLHALNNLAATVQTMWLASSS